MIDLSHFFIYTFTYMKYYKMLEHTADLGIEVWGPDMRELFIHAASAMYGLITDISSVKPASLIRVSVQAQDRDELLKNWLSELLYYFHAKNMLLGSFSIEYLDDKSIISTAKGEEIDSKRHELKHEIKAVTFHGLNIKEEKGRLATEIIFDI